MELPQSPLSLTHDATEHTDNPNVLVAHTNRGILSKVYAIYIWFVIKKYYVILYTMFNLLVFNSSEVK